MASTIKAAVYARISQDTAGEGLGVARQEKLCRDKATSLGWTVVEAYVDNDMSASKGKRRPAYERMLADLEAGTIDAVVVYDLDRLTRRLAELVGFMELHDRLKFSLANVSGDVDLTTSNGIMIAQIKGAVAEQEARRLKERVLAQQRQHAESGNKHQGGRRTYGFTRAMEPVPEEVAIIEELFTRKAAGESLTSLAAWLNSQGVKTVGGGVWDAGLMSRLIRRHDYIGEVTIKGEVVGPAKWDALVTREVWLQANEEVERNNARGKRARKSLLAGFMVCDNCTTKMKQGGAKNEQRYNCPSPVAKPGACGSCSITQAKTDDAVVRAVWSHVQLTGKPEPAQSPRRDYAIEEAALLAEIEQTHSYRKTKVLALSDAVKILGDLQGQLLAVQKAAADDAPRLSPHMQNMLFDWDDSWSLSQKRVWLDQYIEYILVAKADPNLPRKGFKPERIEIHFADGSTKRLRAPDNRYRVTWTADGPVPVEAESKPAVLCSEHDCDKPFYSKGLCHKHYKAAWRRDRAARTAAQ